MKNICVVVLLSSLLAAFPAFAGSILTGDEIKTTFEGNTYSWTHTKRADSGKSYLGADGSRILIKNGKTYEGRWAIDGDKVCFKSKKKICRTIEKAGDAFYLVKDGGKRVVKITKVEEGNSI